MNYYHDAKMEKIFEILKQPRNFEELKIPINSVKNLILKIISSYGTIKTNIINEMTGLHWDILEEAISSLEKDGFCATTGGSFLFSSVEYTITKKGFENAQRILEENAYIGMAPVSYEDYFKLMRAQLKGRYPINIPQEVIEFAFKDVVGADYAKEVLIESCTIGKGIFVYGLPGTGKTFIISKMPDLLPPIVIPKFIEFGGAVIQLFDPDFHKMCSEQPEDTRWVKIYAPFVLTSSELSLNKLETYYNPNKGLYETSPIIKSCGGILLIDDLGRQRDDHELILNRLIMPMENNKDVIYVRGIPVIVHSHFIPVFSTNLDISIIDEAHLRRAPLHIFLKKPPLDELVKVFKKNMNEINEKYSENVIERFKNVYTSRYEKGEGLTPSFAHARDLAQICQAARVIRKKEITDIEILETALDKHILIVLQRLNIDITQVKRKIRTYRLRNDDLKATYEVLKKLCVIKMSYERDSIIVDVEETITPVDLLSDLYDKGIPPTRVDLIIESEKELKRTILK